MRDYQATPKSTIVQLIELFESFRLCHELVKAASNDAIFSGPLSVQLRALILDKHKNSKALLFRLSGGFQNVPNVYYLPQPATPGELVNLFRDAIVMTMNPHLSVRRIYTNQLEIGIEDIINLEVIRFKGTNLTIKQILEWRSNKYGGAHYAHSVTLVERMAKEYGESPIDQFIINLAKLILEFGRILIERLTSIDVNILVKLKQYPEKNDKKFLVTSGLYNRNSYWGLGVTGNGYAFFYIKGLGSEFSNNTSFKNVAPLLLRTDRPVYIRASHRVNDDFRSQTEIFIDGEIISKREHTSIVPIPLTPNEFSAHINYDPKTNAGQDFSFYLGEVFWVDRIINDVELANTAHYMNKKKKFHYIEICSEAYGEKNSGEDELKFHGEVHARGRVF